MELYEFWSCTGRGAVRIVELYGSWSCMDYGVVESGALWIKWRCGSRTCMGLGAELYGSWHYMVVELYRLWSCTSVEAIWWVI